MLTDNIIEYLFKILSSMPTIHNDSERHRKKLKLGKCLAPVSIYKIMKLLIIGYKKLMIEFDIGVLKQIMESDEEFLRRIREPAVYHKTPSEEYYLIHMVQMSYV